MRLNVRRLETKSAERMAFAYFLRTGTSVTSADAQLKFNPNHDPSNGQFTYATGGGSTLTGLASDRQIVADARSISSRSTTSFIRARGASGLLPNRADLPGISRGPLPRDGIDPPVNAGAVRYEPRMGSGANGGPSMLIPMTLERVFPTLTIAPAGAIVAVADDFLGAMRPAREMTAELTRAHSRVLINRVQSIDPKYRFESLGEPQTIEGQLNQIKGLQIDLAVAHFRMRGDVEPLKVQTLRFLQERVDAAYAEGVKMFEAGRMLPKLSRNEAIGNFVDRRVRVELRNFFRGNGIPDALGTPVRVNRRAYEASEGSFTVPDSRVGNVAFDVTLTRKTLSTAQVRGFFRSDFQPMAVVIVRPSQLGANHTYLITKPSGR